MKTFQFNHRGTTINKVQFAEIESYLEDKGIDAMKAFMLMADEKEFVYVSNGFLNGLRNPTSEGEWHHYFLKEGKEFNAFKLSFVN